MVNEKCRKNLVLEGLNAGDAAGLEALFVSMIYIIAGSVCERLQRRLDLKNSVNNLRFNHSDIISVLLKLEDLTMFNYSLYTSSSIPFLI